VEIECNRVSNYQDEKSKKTLPSSHWERLFIDQSRSKNLIQNGLNGLDFIVSWNNY